MRSLAGNKYVPRLGELGCESDGRAVNKFHNFRIELGFFYYDFQMLEGKTSF